MQWLALVVAGEKCVHVLYININIRNLMVHNQYIIHDTLPSATKVNQHLVFSAYCTNIESSTFDSRLRDEDPGVHGNPKILCDQHTLVC